MQTQFVAGAIALGVALSACGEGSPTPATTTNLAPIALHECAKPGHVTNSGYNWGARVSGISCDQAGRFIRHKAYPRAELILRATDTQTSDFKAAGYACVSSRSGRGKYGGWRVTCDQGDQHFAFYWTP